MTAKGAGIAINASRLRHQITIQQQTATTDASGAALAWTVLMTIWAEITVLRGTDAWRGGQFTAQKFAQVTMRYQPGILPDMRVLFGSRIFIVQDCVNVEERNVRLELLCVELDGQA